MPRIFDNIDTGLLPALRETLQVSDKGDFCVGYFNLRGWRAIDDLVQEGPGSPLSPANPFCCPKIPFSTRMPIDSSGVVNN